LQRSGRSSDPRFGGINGLIGEMKEYLSDRKSLFIIPFLIPCAIFQLSEASAFIIFFLPY
jgi:hypothetical protein